MMKNIALAIVLGLSLTTAACSNKPSDTASTVAKIEVALTAAERIAINYVTLPACPKAPICADAEVVARIKQADNVAFDAVMAARASGTNANVAAANAAIAALLNLIPNR